VPNPPPPPPTKKKKEIFENMCVVLIPKFAILRICEAFGNNIVISHIHLDLWLKA
jgi:hypothetical protein